MSVRPPQEASQLHTLSLHFLTVPAQRRRAPLDWRRIVVQWGEAGHAGGQVPARRERRLSRGGGRAGPSDPEKPPLPFPATGVCASVPAREKHRVRVAWAIEGGGNDEGGITHGHLYLFTFWLGRGLLGWHPCGEWVVSCMEGSRYGMSER